MFKQKFLFFPVNEFNTHWFAVVVVNPGSVISNDNAISDKQCGYIVLDLLNPEKTLDDWTGI